MNEKTCACQYKDPDKHTCPNEAGDSGFCYWHDENIKKSDPSVKMLLENYAQNGGFLRGIKLKRAKLQGVDLVNHHNKKGYDFSHADFYRADLTNAHLFNIKLTHASLMKADLRDANLNCANVINANLLGVRWQGSKIENIHIGKVLTQEIQGKKAVAAKDLGLANDYFEQAEEVYRDLRKHAEREGIFTLAGEFIQKELTMRRMQLPLYSLNRFTSKMVDLFCGYGEAPIRIILISGVLIIFCAIMYTFTGLSYQGEIISYDSSASVKDNISLFFECWYYSVVTFTTLGYGDFTPVGLSRAIAAFEAFTGSFTIALFVVVFVKKMTR